MSISEERLEALRENLKKRLSEHRYLHTLGVERAAVKIGERCLPEMIPELRAAALLHDVAKEMESEKQREILGQMSDVTKSDLMSPPVYHSLLAPYVIEKEYKEFAFEPILGAVRYHTTASADMSVFDEIIFVADFVDDTRVYNAAREKREVLYRALDTAVGLDACLECLHSTVISILEFTVGYLKSKNKYINERTVCALEAFSKRYGARPTGEK